MVTSLLLAALPGARLPGGLPETVSGLACDSREAGPGGLFVCVEGLTTDGHRFARAAVENGAAAVVARRSPEPAVDVPVILVPDTREALARLAAAFFNYPSRELGLAAVTGTNGKTTTTHFLTSIAEAAGETTGRVGTVGYDYAGRHFDAPHTTPEAPVLNRLLREMVDHNVRFCAMEASSHALEQKRTFGLDFAAVLFTNLTQDHLDYHPTLDAYYEAKRRLFRRAERGAAGKDPVAALNSDDPAGRRLSNEADGKVVTYGMDPGADYRAVIRAMDGTGSTVEITAPGGSITVRLGMVGPFNVMNAAGSVAVMTELGYPRDAMVRGLEGLTGVPGRMERVDRGQPFAVIVDYAHTPDALERVLEATRAACRGRLIAVFGCGGDRDRGKRPIMGRLAATIADLTFITSDNPRSEEPGAIVKEIETGAREAGGLCRTQVDRRLAIETALAEARPDDAVVIAGKGHEPYQILKDRTVHFDDREEAARVLSELGYGGVHGR